MKTKTIERGCEVKHRITSVIGIATDKSISMHGMVQFCVQRVGLNKDSEPFKSDWYDEGSLERIGDGISASVSEVVDTKVGLGDQVKHLNGFVGVTTERVEYMNGCVSFGVVPDTDEKNTPPSCKYLACQYLTVMTPSAKKVDKDEKGGPSTQAPRNSNSI